MNFPWYLPGAGAAVGAPTLSSVSTSGGAVGDIAGGYPATLTGAGFTGATGVTFGGTAATSVVVVSSTSITCVVPAHAFGAVSVIVTTPGGSNAANTLFEYFSLAQLSPTLNVRGSYAGAPWSGTSSLSAGNAPAVGTALNGFAPASFNGTSNNLVNATGFTSFAGASAGTVLLLLNATSAAADHGVGDRIDNTGLVEQNGGSTTFGLGYSTSGVTVALYDTSASYKELAVAASTGAWHLAFCRWDGTNLQLGVDGGAMSSVASAAFNAASAGGVVVGANYNGGGFFAGLIEEVAMFTSTVSDANRAKIRSYFNTRYFPSGAQV